MVAYAASYELTFSICLFYNSNIQELADQERQSIMEIEDYIRMYRDDIRPTARYASFDYCYNYFQQFRESGAVCRLCQPEVMQMSCLQLAFYLASWGMLRGSTTLLQKSAKYYEKLITQVADFDPRIWDIDIPKYNSNEVIQLLIECDKMITQSIMHHADPNDSWPTATLTTKIMLGIFGNIPAFDMYFIRFFGTRNINKRNLIRLYDYYMMHQQSIDKQAIYTIDFTTSRATHRKYPKAKIVDMIGFIGGKQ
jgi:hypothetical protein